MPSVFSKEMIAGMAAGAAIAALSFGSAYYFIQKSQAEKKVMTPATAESGATAAAAPKPLWTPPFEEHIGAGTKNHPSTPRFQPSPSPLSPSNSTAATAGSAGATAAVTGDVAAQQIKVLMDEREKLTRLLRLAEASNVDVKQVTGGSSGGSGGGGGVTMLSPSEIETLRAIFSQFDVKQEGRISVSEIKGLHAKLGEPLTDAEAQNTIKTLDRDGSGVVTFDKFLLWWYENHKLGKKGDQYTQRFKLISAKLQNDGKDPFDLSRVIIKPAGEPQTTEYRIHFYYKQPNQSLKPISVWHDIPLHHMGQGNITNAGGTIYNFICEIPKWTRAKFEIATGEPFNPIKQDIKHGKLRFQKYGDYMINYGAFPQTWEDPKHVSAETKHRGDNDPIDVCEIGTRQLKSGSIVPVKILGILALIDDGETDWKVIAISISDPLAQVLNDIDDVDEHLPGAIDAIKGYLRDYKSGDGVVNTFALGGQALPRTFATKIVEETHSHWRTLHVSGGKNTV